MAVNQELTTKRIPTAQKNTSIRQLNGAQMVCECLLNEGVEVVFGYPGGSVLPLYHALPEYPLRHILVRHEQGAGFAASGYARASGRPGVCLVTSGPGATNLITPIADAYLDSVPMVILTGQVPTQFIGKDAFQEIDSTGITLPITKHNYLVDRVEDLPLIMREAFQIARSGHPGPVLIDIPRDIQQAEGEFKYPEAVRLRGYRPTLHGNARQIRQAADLINGSQRPLIVAGHGVILSGAYAELRELAEKAEIPVITTLHGISSFPESNPLSFGLIGMHGGAYANQAVQNCDVLVGVGMRFDDRATGRLAGFAPNARIIHIDIDPAEIGKNVKVFLPIVGDVKNVLAALNTAVVANSHGEWLAQIADWRREAPMTMVRDSERLLPQYVVRQLYEVTDGNALICADVGQNQMWAAQFYWYDRPNSYFTSGGLGSMGFALPASMGVHMARPDEPVWVIVGDGGFQMNIQELGTIVQEQIPIKVAILNNGYLGMVRQWQEFFYQRRYSASPIGCPDFAKICEAYCIPSWRVSEKASVRAALERAAECDGPAVVEFLVESEENVYPMVPPGGSLSDAIIGGSS